MTTTHKKIAIFYTDHDDEWTDPYGNFVDMAQKLLNETKDHPSDIEYKMFHIYNNEFPTLEELSSVDEMGNNNYIGIFITGSRYDSFDQTTEWIVKFRTMLDHLLNDNDEKKQYPPIVGICFGHQVIAKTLGCKVDRNPLGFEGGVVPIELNEVGKNIFGTTQLHLSEVHNDIVFDLPKQDGYMNWGSSKKCNVQGLYKENRLLTFQGHPEFVNEIAAKGVEKTRSSLKNRNTKSVNSDAEFDEMIVNTKKYQNDGKLASGKIWQLFSQRL
ncbi:similar to Saccharomyces cerevisiae YLR126C Putative protein of unknown function with similarity to glutamine amidotransferase proteins [Maudiozyma saulgeensis]|uniref:Glutamine amidotransferase domain-containing protein n=1 Tax=Maudiozyma saulgeensis TaxID=1789683 RepID=A0A1X7R539_9SACH|nr:similar to Saccharomyces cerevisiae YLR126C Putative protein of unknown function with similarity to glutamine amidotransferase proteins [Kazachstania saulgeensis]